MRPPKVLTVVVLLTAFTTLSLPGEETSLFQSTIAQDIGTAGFYELISWLDVLGLSTRGDRDALTERLYEFYRIPPEERYTEPDDEENPPLVVDSATRSAYFTLSEIDESYIRLSGGVVLTLRDPDRDVVHRIEAEEIVYNQEQRVLSASGDVVYILERGNTVERFTGAALSVEVDDWEGAFVQGITERERTIEGEAIDFSFAGSYITRSRDDVIVMEDGRITSSTADPPNYEIRARKIWVLAPGEWGLSNALLYVGRVPVFYLPVFFRPGNELYFNPAIGVEDRSGIYVQTTTYLRGAPEAQQSPFSLLQIAETEEDAGNREREGLYLVPAQGPVGTDRDDATVRLLADVYSKLGAYLALDAEYPQVAALSSVELYAAVAVTRNIYAYSYPGQGTTYSPYYISGGQAVQSWNTVSLGSLVIPFRFGLELHADYRKNALSASGDFEAYGDPRFTADLSARSEQIDWLGLIGQGTPVTGSGARNSLLWSLQGSYRPSLQDSGLLLQRFSVQNALISLRWQSRQIPDSELASQPEVLDADQSPQRYFFYPASLNLPSLSLSIGGTLLKLPREKAESEEEAPDIPALIPPWEEPSENEESRPADPGSEISVPSLQPELPSPALPSEWGMTVGYNCNPSMVLDYVFDNDDWTTPEAVDFGLSYGTLSGRVPGSISYSGRIPGGGIRWNGATALTGQYRTVFGRSSGVSDTEWEALQTQAWAYRSFGATNSFTLSLLPLNTIEHWRTSSVSYRNDLVLYRLQFDGVGGDSLPDYRSETIGWDTDTFRQHEISANAVYQANNTQSIRLSASLPPRDPRYSAQAGFSVDPVTLTLSGGVARNESKAWVWEPLASTQRVEFGSVGSVRNNLSYNITDNELTFDRSALALGPFSAGFEVRTSEAYTFVDLVGWQPAGDRRARPTTGSVSLTLDPELEPFWKNRVILELDATASLTADFLRFTNSAFRLSFASHLAIHEFLTASLRVVSSNQQVYVYVPALAESVGREPRNILVDLLRSYNFFRRSDRVDSAFNLQEMQFDLVHELGDWDLSVGYVGRPVLVDGDAGSREYQWRGTLNLNLQWRPIREFRTQVEADSEDITFGGN